LKEVFDQEEQKNKKIPINCCIKPGKMVNYKPGNKIRTDKWEK
jgi:hypothetical protein